MTEARRHGWLEAAAFRVDAHERWALGALIAFYAAVVLAQGALKLVWADELITYYIAKQPGLNGVWQALRAGVDPNPPLMHGLVKGSTALLGGNALGMRAPAMASGLLAMAAMWWMLRRWVRPVFALAGLLAFMATRGFDYTYDARSYAPMMGFAMAAMACWMAARDAGGWRRSAALAGMAVALAAGISSNYYCVLAFFPIAVGEVLGRRIRLGVWLAMVVASLPLLAYLPLIRHNIAEFGPHAWNRPQASMIAMSYLELVEGIFWPVLGLGIYAVWKRRGEWTVPRAEAEAVGVLLIYPFIGYAIAVGGAGLISPRCVAPVCCGVGLAAGVLVQRVFGGSLRAGMAVVVVMVVWVGVREGVCAGMLFAQRREFQTLVLDLGDPRGILLVGDSSLVLPLYFYSDDDTRRRIVFPVDFDAIHRFEKDDSGEQNLWAGREGIFPFRIVKFSDFQFGRYSNGGLAPVGPLGDEWIRTHWYWCWRPVTVLARPDGWLANSVRTEGFTLTPMREYPNWGWLGGVLTPMAHAETRPLLASQPCKLGL